MADRPEKRRRTLWGILWRFLASLVLIPVVAAMVVVMPDFLTLGLPGAALLGPKREAISFFSGVGVYLLLHIFLHRPITAYVFSHELTHAIWARLTGHKVRRIKVGKDSGETVTEGGNFAVRLAPYCFPLYALVWIGGWAGLELLLPDMRDYHGVLFFGIGFTYAFHVLLTTHFMKVGQRDLHAEGYCFSMAVILAVNLELAAAVYAAIAHKATWWRFQVDVWRCLCRWTEAVTDYFG
jgi:hypothetical protein